MFSLMKNYTVIPNMISKQLDSSDTYRFTCLTFTPRKDGYTDSTYKQIGHYINQQKPESEDTIRGFVKRLKESGVIKIERFIKDGKKRNKYFIEKPETNFRMIKKELLDIDLSVKLKGFMIQLFTITTNNTLVVPLSINKLVKLIKVSKPTAIKYLKELKELELVKKIEAGYELTSRFFKIGAESEVKKIAESIKGCDYLESRFNSTDWSKIVNPLDYWRKVEAGVIGMKKQPEIEYEIML